MTTYRVFVPALGALLLIAGPALAQTGGTPSGPRPSRPLTAPPAPPTTPSSPLGAPSTIDPRSGLPSSQPETNPRTPRDQDRELDA